MSNPEDERPDRRALGRLEQAVEAAVTRMDDLEKRVQMADEKRRELESLLERFRIGDEDPATLSRRAARLGEENERLRQRIDEGRGAVERMLARIRFLQEQSES